MTPPEAALAFFVFGGGFWVLRPLAGALAKRIGGDVPPPRDATQDEAVQTELQQLRAEMSELAERVDFAERLLAQQREASRVGPGGT
jgi:hypothetical protein